MDYCSGSQTVGRAPLVGCRGTASGAQEEMQIDLYWELHIVHKFKGHGHKTKSLTDTWRNACTSVYMFTLRREQVTLVRRPRLADSWRFAKSRNKSSTLSMNWEWLYQDPVKTKKIPVWEPLDYCVCVWVSRFCALIRIFAKCKDNVTPRGSAFVRPIANGFRDSHELRC